LGISRNENKRIELERTFGGLEVDFYIYQQVGCPVVPVDSLLGVDYRSKAPRNQ